MHQVERGHTRIANTLLDAIVQTAMSGACFRVLLWVIRNSYGYNRKITRPSTVRKMAQEIKMTASSVGLALLVLMENGIIIKNEAGEMSLNKSKLPTVRETGRVQLSEKLDKVSEKLDGIVRETGQSECNIKKDNLKTTRKTGFTPPSLVEVEAYCKERGNAVNAGKWISWYEANGWVVGKAKMKNWKAAIRYWEHSNYDSKPTPSGSKPIPSKYGVGEVF